MTTSCRSKRQRVYYRDVFLRAAEMMEEGHSFSCVAISHAVAEWTGRYEGPVPPRKYAEKALLASRAITRPCDIVFTGPEHRDLTAEQKRDIRVLWLLFLAEEVGQKYCLLSRPTNQEEDNDSTP